jgi:hypothetical protein
MPESQSAPTQQVAEWLSRFSTALDRHDWAGVVNLFASECYWRDLVAFTWNIKTLEGKDEIAAMLAATIPGVQPGHWQIAGEATRENDVTAGWFLFETAVARGKGYLRLTAGQCWTLLTTITELKGFEERRGATRVPGVQHGVFRNRKTWLEQKTQEEAELGDTTQPYCIIVGGGGQGGIALAARLKCLNVPTLFLEKNARLAGDRRTRREDDRVATQTTGPGDGHVRHSERAADSRGRDVSRDAAPFQSVPRRRRLPRQKMRRPGLQQFGPRHLCRAVGAGSRRHHDPTFVDACRPV